MLAASRVQSISLVACISRKPPEGSGTRMVTVTATSWTCGQFPHTRGCPVARAISMQRWHPSVRPGSVPTMEMLAAAASFIPPTFVMAKALLDFSK